MSALTIARAIGFASFRSSIASRARGRPMSASTLASVRPWYARLWIVKTVEVLPRARLRSTSGTRSAACQSCA
jgi:hypothetical protein